MASDAGSHADAEASLCPSSTPAPFVYAPYTSAESDIVPSYWAQRYEDEAARYWDKFYSRNADRFFKDRHYLGKEWSELKPQDDAGDDDDDGAADERAEMSSLCAGDSELVLLDAGCGVGNTMLPLMRANPRLRVYGFDFAESAVRLVQANQLYETGRIVAAVGDLTVGELPAELAGCQAHLCTLIFVLSAISEPKMAASLRAISSGLRDGGLVLFRDYAEGSAPVLTRMPWGPVASMRRATYAGYHPGASVRRVTYAVYHPGASVRHVRATRTSLPRTAILGARDSLPPEPMCGTCAVRVPCCGRAVPYVPRPVAP